MRINSRHLCKTCCFYIPDDEGAGYGLCCVEPQFKSVKPYQGACKHYGSDEDDDNIDYSSMFDSSSDDEDENYF